MRTEAQFGGKAMTEADSNAAIDAGRKAGSSHAERLPLLYQGMLTVIARIQTGQQQLIDATAFQKRMESLLDEIEREAIKVGYRNQDIQDAHYATIAFLDETIQQSKDPIRNQWTPLQAKRYAQAVAGEGVFDRLKSIRVRRDSEELADLLEVYDLCFLLGYQGRYAVGGRSELDRLIEDLGEQIGRIRGKPAALSPDGALPPAPKVTAPARAPEGRWKLIAIVCIALACVTWVVLQLILNLYTDAAVRTISTP